MIAILGNKKRIRNMSYSNKNVCLIENYDKQGWVMMQMASKYEAES